MWGLLPMTNGIVMLLNGPFDLQIPDLGPNLDSVWRAGSCRDRLLWPHCDDDTRHEGTHWQFGYKCAFLLDHQSSQRHRWWQLLPFPGLICPILSVETSLNGHFLLMQDRADWPPDLSRPLDDCPGVSKADCCNDYAKRSEDMPEPYSLKTVSNQWQNALVQTCITCPV